MYAQPVPESCRGQDADSQWQSASGRFVWLAQRCRSRGICPVHCASCPPSCDNHTCPMGHREGSADRNHYVLNRVRPYGFAAHRDRECSNLLQAAMQRDGSTRPAAAGVKGRRSDNAGYAHENQQWRTPYMANKRRFMHNANSDSLARRLTRGDASSDAPGRS